MSQLFQKNLVVWILLIVGSFPGLGQEKPYEPTSEQGLVAAGQLMGKLRQLSVSADGDGIDQILKGSQVQLAIGWNLAPLTEENDLLALRNYLASREFLNAHSNIGTNPEGGYFSIGQIQVWFDRTPVLVLFRFQRDGVKDSFGKSTVTSHESAQNMQDFQRLMQQVQSTKDLPMLIMMLLNGESLAKDPIRARRLVQLYGLKDFSKIFKRRTSTERITFCRDFFHGQAFSEICASKVAQSTPTKPSQEKEPPSTTPEISSPVVMPSLANTGLESLKTWVQLPQDDMTAMIARLYRSFEAYEKAEIILLRRAASPNGMGKKMDPAAVVRSQLTEVATLVAGMNAEGKVAPGDSNGENVQLFRQIQSLSANYVEGSTDRKEEGPTSAELWTEAFVAWGAYMQAWQLLMAYGPGGKRSENWSSVEGLLVRQRLLLHEKCASVGC